MEHRWGERIVCRIPVRVEDGVGLILDAHLVNVSVSGAFLEIRTAPRLSSALFVKFDSISARMRARPRVMAYVVRRTMRGLGLEWADFAPSIVRALIAVPPAPIKHRAIVRAKCTDPRFAT